MYYKVLSVSKTKLDVFIINRLHDFQIPFSITEYSKLDSLKFKDLEL